MLLPLRYGKAGLCRRVIPKSYRRVLDDVMMED